MRRSPDAGLPADEPDVQDTGRQELHDPQPHDGTKQPHRHWKSLAIDQDRPFIFSIEAVPGRKNRDSEGKWEESCSKSCRLNGLLS